MNASLVMLANGFLFGSGLILAEMKVHGVMRSGKSAEGLGHGLVVHDGTSYLFIETNPTQPKQEEK